MDHLRSPKVIHEKRAKAPEDLTHYFTNHPQMAQFNYEMMQIKLLWNKNKYEEILKQLKDQEAVLVDLQRECDDFKKGIDDAQKRREMEEVLRNST